MCYSLLEWGNKLFLCQTSLSIQGSLFHSDPLGRVILGHYRLSTEFISLISAITSAFTSDTTPRTTDRNTPLHPLVPPPGAILSVVELLSSPANKPLAISGGGSYATPYTSNPDRQSLTIHHQLWQFHHIILFLMHPRQTKCRP